MFHVSVMELVGAILVGVSAVAAVDAKRPRGRTFAIACAAVGLIMAWIGRR